MPVWIPVYKGVLTLYTPHPCLHIAKVNQDTFITPHTHTHTLSQAWKDYWSNVNCSYALSRNILTSVTQENLALIKYLNVFALVFVFHHLPEVMNCFVNLDNCCCVPSCFCCLFSAWRNLFRASFWPEWRLVFIFMDNLHYLIQLRNNHLAFYSSGWLLWLN